MADQLWNAYVGNYFNYEIESLLCYREVVKKLTKKTGSVWFKLRFNRKQKSCCYIVETVYNFLSKSSDRFCFIEYHHHWLDSPTWALAFLRSFCQLLSGYCFFRLHDNMTRVFSRAGLSAPFPTPGYPGGPMFSVIVISLSWLLPILKCQDLAFCPCMT
jgi:hypothetical protein